MSDVSKTLLLITVLPNLLWWITTAAIMLSKKRTISGLIRGVYCADHYGILNAFKCDESSKQTS